jgi:CRISPR/Cas system-associated endoribonuclease Cas2
MAERIRYLLTYDIRDERRLRRVHEVAVDHGERLQYSVYICDLTRQELVRLRARLRKELNLAVDSVSTPFPHFSWAVSVPHRGAGWSVSGVQ